MTRCKTASARRRVRRVEQNSNLGSTHLLLDRVALLRAVSPGPEFEIHGSAGLVYMDDAHGHPGDIECVEELLCDGRQRRGDGSVELLGCAEARREKRGENSRAHSVRGRDSHGRSARCLPICNRS